MNNAAVNTRAQVFMWPQVSNSLNGDGWATRRPSVQLLEEPKDHVPRGLCHLPVPPAAREGSDSPASLPTSFVSFSITASLVGVTGILLEQDNEHFPKSRVQYYPSLKGFCTPPISTGNFPCTHTQHTDTHTHSPCRHSPDTSPRHCWRTRHLTVSSEDHRGGGPCLVLPPKTVRRGPPVLPSPPSHAHMRAFTRHHRCFYFNPPDVRGSTCPTKHHTCHTAGMRSAEGRSTMAPLMQQAALGLATFLQMSPRDQPQPS